MAYVYLADRSRCPGAHDVCDWKQPPRYERGRARRPPRRSTANERGRLGRARDEGHARHDPRAAAAARSPRSTCRSRSTSATARPMPVEDYLRAHPHPTYVASRRAAARSRGRRPRRARRRHHAARAQRRSRRAPRIATTSRRRTTRGTAARRGEDSEIPLIVANRQHGAAAIGVHVGSLLGDARSSRSWRTCYWLYVPARSAASPSRAWMPASSSDSISAPKRSSESRPR